MPKFKGFDDWIEIFRGGEQVDSMGIPHDGDAIVQKALKSFNAAKHEPPLVLGHPIDNAPAFGWVSDLKEAVENGAKVLLAKFKQVVPEFEDAAKKGLYKKRSASFYPDGRLRHVGFLGAAPPAVKGLADLKFDERDESVTFDFSVEGMSTIGRVFRNLRDYFIEKEGKEKADNIIQGWDVDRIQELALQPITETGEAVFRENSPTPGRRQEEKHMAEKDKTFTENDLEAAKKTAAEEARKEGKEEAEAEFAEKERGRIRKAQEKEISEWCEKSLKAGKLLPSWNKLGLKEFMLRLDAAETVSFAEGEAKASSLTWFRKFMEELPKVVVFKEVADRDGDVDAGSAGERLDAIVNRKMAQDKDLSFSEALGLAQDENPALAFEYQQEIRG